MCFCFVGQVNAWKCMPKPLFTHIFHSSPIFVGVGLSHADEACWAFSLTILLLFSSFSPAHNSFYVLPGNGNKGTMILGVWRGHFFLVITLGSSLMFFYNSPIFLHGWEVIFVLLNEWEKRPTILGALRGCFPSPHAVELASFFSLMISIVSSLFHTHKFIGVFLNG